MRNVRKLQPVLTFLFVLCAATLLSAQANVLTWHNDNWRDGLNSNETILAQANVNPSQFGKICSAAVDGQIFAQPLVVYTGGKNIVYVVTMNDSVYAVDGTSCNIISSVSLLQSGEEAVKCADVGGPKCNTVRPILGILSTPVIDITTNTIYIVAESELTTGQCATKKPNNCFVHRVHALDLTTLSEKFNGPIAIAGMFNKGTFTSKNHIQRPGLLLVSGAMSNGDNGVYIAFSEMDGTGTPGVNIPHGWLFGYDAQNLSAAPLVWNSTPDGEGGGMWASGSGLAAGLDSPGGNTYLYLVTGDGDFTANTGGEDYGDSFVKLTTNLTPYDYFTPFSQSCMNINDQDFGSSGTMLVPDSGSTYYAIAASKQGIIYAMNRANPGQYSNPTNSTCPATGTNLNLQTFQGSAHAYYTTPASWNSQIYYIPMFGPMTKYALNLSTPPKCLSPVICTAGTVRTTQTFQYGTNLSISSSGTTTGTAIVWTTAGNGWPTAATPAPVTLFAFDAEHLTAKPSTIPPLWDSTKCPTRDKTGNATKFVVPTIANGNVYLGDMDPTDNTNTRGRLEVFGLTNATCN